MPEYNRANRLGQHESVGQRPMQVDKQQPSPWPCVLMLAGLLAFCLAAPYYWQHDRPTVPTTDAEVFRLQALGSGRFAIDGARSPVSSTLILPNSHFDFGNVRAGTVGSVSNSDLLNLWTPPTIEELIAARATYGQFEPVANQCDGQWFQWVPVANSVGPPTNFNNAANRAESPFVDQTPPFVTKSLQLLGNVIAEYSPANLASKVIARLTDAVRADRIATSRVTPIYGPSASANSSILLVGPGDRLAMRPNALNAKSWCVPQVLYEQLQRLAEHGYSAQWASQVSNQLHALTERDQLLGDDVQSILADLSDAAQEAVRMADNTDDDRLRVELLRAHWALARRLDCWVAMHEERVAFHFQDRVAARGELSPYFDSAPGEPPTPADIVALSKNLETYEQTRDPRLASQVTQQQRALAASPASFDRALADAVDHHYRNANIRVALTAEMINRMVSANRLESRPVSDRIAGAFVRGQSDISSRSRVELAPANDEWQLKVETSGVVESTTQADAGPVRLRSRGATDFSGSKSVIVRADGVHLQPSNIEATSRNRLVGVTTDYDWVPLFGGYARNRAKQEYQARQNRVRTEMESRVSAEASDTLDRETHEAMERARQQLYARFTERFDEYGIKLSTVEMKSSPERLVARVRVAGDDQFGSHTPRPRALSDSLASVQVHETAMTNLAVTLGLDGQRLTGAELQQKIREQFPKMAASAPQEIRRDTVFQFAPKNAVQVRVKDGRLELAIAFDSVELDGGAISNVTVHAFYTPSIDGLTAELARDGVLGIEGQFSGRERARLHNIFQSVLPPERKLPIANLENQEGRHLDGLMITQLVLEDGWVGLAIGPESSNRVAERSRSLR